MEIRSVSLKDYSSLRVGGKGDMVIVKNGEELTDALMHAKSTGLRVHLLGGGTNSYFDEDLSGVLFIKLDLKGVDYLRKDNEVHMTIAASEVWDDIVKDAAERNLWGVENLSLIPGTVGAAPMQNIGAYGVELADTLVNVRALDTDTLEMVEFSKEMCEFGYRDSLFKRMKGRHIITSITLRLSTEPRPVLSYKPLDALKEKEGVTPGMVRQVVIETRTNKLPNHEVNPNAGSFFKNPIVDAKVSQELKSMYPDMPAIEASEMYKIPAAWLIEYVADMKGFRMGDIGTWPKQPLVLVNYGEATADDVDALAQEIQNRIKEKTGIILEQEVNRVR